MRTSNRSRSRAASWLAALVAVVAVLGASLPATAGAAPLPVTVYSVWQAQNVRAWGELTWTSRNSFTMPVSYVADTACDSQPVFWEIDVDGRWFGARRWDEAGCGTQVKWTNVGATDSVGIRYISVYACRDTVVVECGHLNYYNPLY
jgi:hypothetical protein